MSELSIIIPTHKRADILAQCLLRLEAQTVRSQLEVIVISDGHDAKTAELLKETDVYSFPLTFIEIEKAQQGVARNHGVRRASSQYCLFLGDDIFLAPNACEKHIAVLKGNDATAVLGYTTWDPAVGITAVMQWLESSGWQFGYPIIAEHAHGFIPKHLQHRFTYTSHIGLSTKAARTHPFREDVSLYGWEDIEWGMRLRKAGIQLFYEPDAMALHHHRMTMEDSLKRMETLGTSAIHFQKIVPGFDRLPRGFKKIAYHVAALLPTMAGKHRKAFLRGMKASAHS